MFFCLCAQNHRDDAKEKLKAARAAGREVWHCPVGFVDPLWLARCRHWGCRRNLTALKAQLPRMECSSVRRRPVWNDWTNCLRQQKQAEMLGRNTMHRLGSSSSPSQLANATSALRRNNISTASQTYLGGDLRVRISTACHATFIAIYAANKLLEYTGEDSRNGGFYGDTYIDEQVSQRLRTCMYALGAHVCVSADEEAQGGCRIV